MDLYSLAKFFGIIFLTFCAEKVFSFFLVKFAQKQSSKTKTNLDDNIIEVAKSPLMNMIYLSGIYFALASLNLDKAAIEFSYSAYRVSLIGMSAWLAFKLIDVFNEFLNQEIIKTQKRQNSILVHFLPLIKRTMKVLVGVIALTTAVQQLGYSAASILTGFGITGLAVGFAAKETISNVFGSFSLILDKAYKVGDWIVIDKEVSGQSAEGIVEDISLRSTKIRAFDNTLLIIPNHQMGNATIKNVSQHKKRRIYEFIDLTYDTPADKVEKAVDICRHIVASHPEMEDYFQIHLNKLGSHSLQIMFYVFTQTTDWGEYLRIRQELFLSIMREFEALGVEFAFPTQTLYLKNESAKDPTPQANL